MANIQDIIDRIHQLQDITAEQLAEIEELTARLVECCGEPEPPAPELGYLTFISHDDGNYVKLNNFNGNQPRVYYTLDDGATWVDWQANNYDRINLPNGAVVKMYGDNPHGFSQSESTYSKFFVKFPTDCSGTVMSLISESMPDTIPNDYCFYRCFYESWLLSAPVLSANNFKWGCYKEMFMNCTALTAAPEILATIGESYSCERMFKGCTALVSGPSVLMVPETYKYTYSEMFDGCYSLVNAPAICATTIYDYSCYRMFADCSSLMVAPELPATTLGPWSYAYMFSGCLALQTPPHSLPALFTSANSPYVYCGMFMKCTSLTYSPVIETRMVFQREFEKMFTDCQVLSTVTCLTEDDITGVQSGDWLLGVADNGTFVKSPNATNWASGPNGIPVGWSVQDA